MVVRALAAEPHKPGRRLKGLEETDEQGVDSPASNWRTKAIIVEECLFDRPGGCDVVGATDRTEVVDEPGRRLVPKPALPGSRSPPSTHL